MGTQGGMSPTGTNGPFLASCLLKGTPPVRVCVCACLHAGGCFSQMGLGVTGQRLCSVGIMADEQHLQILISVNTWGHPGPLSFSSDSLKQWVGLRLRVGSGSLSPRKESGTGQQPEVSGNRQKQQQLFGARKRRAQGGPGHMGRIDGGEGTPKDLSLVDDCW